MGQTQWSGKSVMLTDWKTETKFMRDKPLYFLDRRWYTTGNNGFPEREKNDGNTASEEKQRR